MQNRLRHSGYGLGSALTAAGGVFLWENYWASHLDTWHRSRTGLVLNENQVPLNGAILPAVAKFNGTDDVINVNDADVFSFTDGSNDKPFSIEVVFKTPAIWPAIQVTIIIAKDLAATGTKREWGFLITNADKYPRIFLKSEGGNNQQSIDGNLVCTADTWYRMFITYDGSGGNTAYQGLTIYNQAVPLDVAASTANAYTHMNNTDAPVSFGKYGSTTPVYSATQVSYCKIYNVELSQAQITGIVAGTNVTDIFHMIFVGNMNYEYDVTGGRNGLRSGTGITKDYSSNGSPYLLDNGWSLWDVERVPYGATTTEIVALGLTESYVFPASLDKINMADCLIDFDPTAGANALLDVFDRSNATIHTAASRASIYYNALFPYRFQIDEIANYEVYSGYYHAAYIDRVLSRVQTSGAFVTRLDEVLNSPTPM